MKYAAMFLLAFAPSIASASIINYEASSILFDGHENSSGNAFYGCVADFRFSVDTESEEIISSSASCSSAGVYLESTGRSQVTFFDDAPTSPDPVWSLAFSQEMVAVGDPDSVWQFSLAEFFFFGDRALALSSIDVENGWAKIFAISEIKNGERDSSVIGWANNRIYKVPEPLSIALLAFGLIGLSLRRRSPGVDHSRP